MPTTNNNANKANTIEINPNLGTIASFNEKLITDAGFTMKAITMDGEKTLSKVSLPEVILDDACRIGVSQSLRQRYYIPQIKENFKARIAAIKESLDDDDVCISIRTISLQKGTDTYNFRVHGQRTKTVLLKNKNGVCHTLLDINELMKELAELFETTCYFAAGKYKAPMRCGITIK